MPNIADRETLEAWLATRSPEERTLIAARAALRAIPTLIEAPELKNEGILASFRCAATALAWTIHPTSELASAAKKSADFADVKLPSPFFIDRYRCLLSSRSAAGLVSDAGHEDTDDAMYSIDAGASDPNMFIETILDANFINDDENVGDLIVRPLYVQDPSEQIITAWQILRKHLLEANSNWRVWTDWYQALLDGEPVDWALEEARVLIPDETWEQGAAAVNARIAELIEEHQLPGKSPPPLADAAETDAPPMDLDALLAAPQLRAALADFSLDQLANLMRMVPFIEDIRSLDDPALAKDRANRLSELKDLAGELGRDVRRDKGNAPAWLPRDLQRYGREAARDVADVRPGRLMDLGAGFAAALRDEDVEWSLGEHYFGKLERLVEKHGDLMRDYFASTLARMRPLDQIESRPGAEPEETLAALEATVDAIDHADWGDYPAPDPEIPAVLSDRVEDLRATLDRIRRTNDEARRQQLERMFWRRAKATTVTALRYALKVYSASSSTLGTAAAAKALFPKTFAAAIETLRAIFPGIPSP